MIGLLVSLALAPAHARPPLVDFDVRCEGLVCTFTDWTLDDGDLVDRWWDLGDGTGAAGPSVAHTFPERGTWPVTLRVRDDEGHEVELVREVRVWESARLRTSRIVDAPVSEVVSLAVRPHGASAGAVRWWDEREERSEASEAD